MLEKYKKKVYLKSMIKKGSPSIFASDKLLQKS